MSAVCPLRSSGQTQDRHLAGTWEQPTHGSFIHFFSNPLVGTITGWGTLPRGLAAATRWWCQSPPTHPLGSELLCHRLPTHSGPSREKLPLGLGAGLAGGGAGGVGMAPSGVEVGLRSPARAPHRQLFPEWGF